MRHSSTVGILLLTLAPVLSAGCASTTGPVALRQPATSPATALSDVELPLGTACVIHVRGRKVVRGRLAGIAADRLELDVDGGEAGPQRLVFAHDDVDVLARMVTMSEGKRAKIRAAIGALASLPFAVSMFGDMMMPAAIAGALIGYNSGHARPEILFERRLVPQ